MGSSEEGPVPAHVVVSSICMYESARGVRAGEGRQKGRRSQVMEGFVGIDEEFKVDVSRHRRPVEVIKDRGDLCEKMSS